MKRFLLVLFTMTVFASAPSGCDHDDSRPFESGTYNYSGIDLEGQKVTEGTFEISIEDSVIVGIKNIEIVGQNVGNVTDAGAALIGGAITEDGTVVIHLLEGQGPYMFIRGRYHDDKLEGDRFWGISGGAPETVIGTFISKRINSE